MPVATRTGVPGGAPAASVPLPARFAGADGGDQPVGQFRRPADQGLRRVAEAQPLPVDGPGGSAGALDPGGAGGEGPGPPARGGGGGAPTPPPGPPPGGGPPARPGGG